MANEYSVIVSDIRNFSSHRHFLANHSQAGRLTAFIQEMLNSAITFVPFAPKRYFDVERPLLNYTGDGFVLAIPGKNSSLITLKWLAKFDTWLSKAVEKYNDNFIDDFPDHRIELLDFGIGIHIGQIVKFRFKGFGDKGVKQSNVGFLGTAVNIASRVEQRTKDHPYPILCTKAFRDALRLALGAARWVNIKECFISIGQHRIRGIDDTLLYRFHAGYHRLLKREQLV